MSGGRKNAPEIEPVPWDRAGHFLVGDALRPSGMVRKAVRDGRAVRVPTAHKGTRYYAPCVWVTATERESGESPSYALHDATSPGTLVCALSPKEDGSGYRVTDAGGAELGLIHRTSAAKRAVQHAWWFRQPGHPDVVARYQWARSTKDLAANGQERLAQGAVAVVGGVVNALLDGGVEGGDHARARRPVTWRTQDEPETVVLTSMPVEGIRTYLTHAPWLDRRLAFALAVLREA